MKNKKKKRIASPLKRSIYQYLYLMILTFWMNDALEAFTTIK